MQYTVRSTYVDYTDADNLTRHTTELTYKGFWPFERRSRYPDWKWLAVVTAWGETDLYICEGPQVAPELKRMVEAEGGEPDDVEIKFLKRTDKDINDGFRVFKEGNMWCAVDHDFVNLQVSRAEFARTPEVAIAKLRHRSESPEEAVIVIPEPPMTADQIDHADIYGRKYKK